MFNIYLIFIIKQTFKQILYKWYLKNKNKNNNNLKYLQKILMNHF